jgi:hypothetical protein
LKFRGWLLMLLFVHVMLHPWVHSIDLGGPSSEILLSHASCSGQPALSGDQCELCRIGHNATAAPMLPQVDLLNPLWIHTALQAVNYESLQADLRLPSRAPPAL